MKPRIATLRAMLYTAKCYWPGINRSELEQAAARALQHARKRSRGGGGVAYLGSILFPDDELVLCLFDAASPAAAKRASEAAGIPCERIMETAWLTAPNVAELLGDGKG